jgi:hypothetical protein
MILGEMKYFREITGLEKSRGKKKKKTEGTYPYVRCLCSFPVFKNPPCHGRGGGTLPLSLSTCTPLPTSCIRFHIFQGRLGEGVWGNFSCTFNE